MNILLSRALLAFALLFQACSEAPVQDKVPHQEKEKVQKPDTTVKKKTVLQSESVSIKPFGTPFLLIQNCAALWPIACDSNLITDKKLAMEEIGPIMLAERSYLGQQNKNKKLRTNKAE